jgi:hypothetical protein
MTLGDRMKPLWWVLSWINCSTRSATDGRDGINTLGDGSLIDLSLLDREALSYAERRSTLMEWFLSSRRRQNRPRERSVVLVNGTSGQVTLE